MIFLTTISNNPPVSNIFPSVRHVKSNAVKKIYGAVLTCFTAQFLAQKRTPRRRPRIRVRAAPFLRSSLRARRRRRDAWSLFVPAARDTSQPCQCDPRWEFHYRGHDLCPSRLANDDALFVQMEASVIIPVPLCAPPMAREKCMSRGRGWFS